MHRRPLFFLQRPHALAWWVWGALALWCGVLLGSMVSPWMLAQGAQRVALGAAVDGAERTLCTAPSETTRPGPRAAEQVRSGAARAGAPIPAAAHGAHAAATPTAAEAPAAHLLHGIDCPLCLPALALTAQAGSARFVPVQQGAAALAAVPARWVRQVAAALPARGPPTYTRSS